MSENNTDPETPTEQPSRPRNADGTFMSKTQIEGLEQKAKESFAYLKENNAALMRGTGLTTDNFEGMNELQINKFLINFHKKKESEPIPEPEKDSNTPILGTPIGSGRQKYFIDKYLTIDPKEKTIDFEAPASIVMGSKHKTEEEAIKKWLDLR